MKTKPNLTYEGFASAKLILKWVDPQKKSVAQSKYFELFNFLEQVSEAFKRKRGSSVSRSFLKLDIWDLYRRSNRINFRHVFVTVK